MPKRVENLDCMCEADLSQYIDRHQHDRRYVTEVSIARHIRDAMDLRSRGNVDRALRLERQADRLYDTLAPQEKW